jgi:serine phosphatase RsbU (regulator of sigma subunit)/transposase
MSNAQETTRRLAKEAVNYLLRQDDLHLENLVKNVARTNSKLAYVFVTDNDNVIWAHSVTRLMFTPFHPGKGFRPSVGHELVVQQVRGQKNRLIHDVAYPVFLGKLRLGTAHLGVMEQSIQDDIKSGRRNAFLIFLIALAASTSGAYFLMSFLVDPIRKLTDGMLAVSEGRLDHRIIIRTNDEFGQIARVFNEMTQRFSESQKNLIEQERIHQEMEVAQEIQHALLPRETPVIEGYEVDSLYRSAKEVGGDYFDFVWVDDNILGIAVADVSGKGVPGSLVMTMIRTALRLEARHNHSAAEVMAKVNNFVTRDMKKGMFVTMFYIILDSRRRVINYSSAGHNPMILYREENDQIYFLKPRGFPLGIDLPDPELFRKSLTQEHVSLKKNDLLLVYTDGITEAMNAQREQFGEKRLIDLVRYYHHLTATEFIAKLSEEIAQFTGDYPQSDDITFVAIKEKLKASEVQTNLQKNLFDLVENQGVSVKDACKRLNVSPYTYYRFKRLRASQGEAGLELAANKQENMQHVSLDDMVRIKEIVRLYPDLGATRLVQMLAAPENGGVVLPERLVYQTLKRLGLSTREQRLAFAARKKPDDHRDLG